MHTIFLTIAWQHGLGRHFDSLDESQQQHVLKLIIAGVELFAIVTCMFGRISFCAFLLFIISPIDRKKRHLLWLVIAIQIIANVVCLVQIYAQCGSKVEALWTFKLASTASCQSPMVQTLIGYGNHRTGEEAATETDFLQYRAL